MFNLFKRKKKMKYKIGDKVKVRTDLERSQIYGNLTLLGTMYHYRGAVLTIGLISENNTFLCLENPYWWSLDMVEPCKTSFTKSDLKTGLVVELRKRDRMIVLNEKYLVDKETYMLLDNINDDLTHKFLDKHSIDKVFYVPGPATLNNVLNNLSTESLTLLWERREFKEVTMDEIAEKFNIPVGQLKIKK